MRKLFCTALIAASMLCLLFGCVKNEQPAQSDTAEGKTDFIPINAAAPAARITDAEDTFSGVQSVYPEIEGTKADNVINAKIRSCVSALCADKTFEAKSVDYEIGYNARGILSVLIRAALKEGSAFRCRTLNVNTESGEDILLSDLFSADETWQRLCTMYISTAVRLKKTDAYASVDVNAKKSFYMTEKKLVIICETYEITYYGSGDILFEVPYSLISAFSAEGGALDTILREG